MHWETVIGLEVHVQLKTLSKIFSGAATQYGAEPNTQACAVDLGLPGILPVLNKQAVAMAMKFGLAVDGKIAEKSVFARKNYFYPDLPKGYQISQFELPIVSGGHLDIFLNDKSKRINLERAHLEEDAGKSLHEDFHGMSGIDLNRAGTPLLEIVSAPDMRSAEEAIAYLKSLYALVTYLDICDGNMQEGSFRCDVNVSIRPQGSHTLGTRTETKNVNSFRFVERAIEYEVERQIELLENGNKVVQQTLLFDADKNSTRPMRSKEEANDYRYFPDPDLLPVCVDKAWLETIKKDLPELPRQRWQRFQDKFELSAYDASLLTANKGVADYFEKVLQATQVPAKIVTNWIMGECSAALNKDNLDITQCPISANNLAALLNRIEDNTISGKMAKNVFENMWQTSQDADTIIQEQGLKQVTDVASIEAIIDGVLAANPKQLEAYRAGKEKLFGFFVGQVMKASQGKANPAQVNQLLKHKLQKGD